MNIDTDIQDILTKIKNLANIKEKKHALYDVLCKYTNHYMVHFQMGNVYNSLNKLHNAIKYYRLSIRFNNTFSESFFSLGLIYEKLGMDDNMIMLVTKATELKPDPRYYNALGCIHSKKDKFVEAIEYFNKGIKEIESIGTLNNHILKVLYTNISSAYMHLSDCDNALTYLNKSDDIKCDLPESVELQYNKMKDMHRGIIYMMDNKFEETEKIYTETVNKSNITPDIKATLLNTLAAIHSSYGDVHKSIEMYDEILKLHSIHKFDIKQVIEMFQNKLYAYNFVELDREFVFKEHLKLGDLIRDICLTKHPETRIINKTDDRPLRIGFVSPNFLLHPVMMFLGKLFELYDRTKYKVYCYSNTIKHDEITENIKNAIDTWTDINNINDMQCVETIKNDGIDVLIDLAGNTAQNRLAIFYYKPAPIQITCIGYPNTTGLYQMDYRISDRYVEWGVSTPHTPLNIKIKQEVHSDRGDGGLSPPYYTEKFLYMPKCFLCYTPLDDIEIDVNIHNPVIFGVMNKFDKVSDNCFALWKRILDACPESKILFKFRFDMVDKIRRIIIDKMGISKDRILFRNYSKTYSEHMNIFNDVDICLDTFPYSGTTTSCESIYMGRPCITYYKNGIHAHNVTSSILHYSGFDEFIAHDEDEYKNIAINLVRDTDRLKIYRQTMRKKFLDSMDPQEYVNSFFKVVSDVHKLNCV